MKKNVIMNVICIIMLFISVSSMTFAKCVNDENEKLRNGIINSREVPIELKKELGLY